MIVYQVLILIQRGNIITYIPSTKDITTIIVSNRIHSIMHCDNIIVLEKGEIIESGNHTDLIKLNGFYHKLNSIQAQNIN